MFYQFYTILDLHFNESRSFLLVNATKRYQFKAKDSEINALCLDNISKDFTINDITKTGLKGVVNFFSVDTVLYHFNPVDTNNILDIHTYLMNRT